MNGKHTLATAAALLADPARASMMTLLLKGRAAAAGELAREANVSAQSASMHLAQLLEGGFVQVTQQGRHRYYSIASPEVEHAIEALGVIATSRKQKPIGESEAIRYARTCYDHLAGRLGVALAGSLERERLLIRGEEREYRLTRRGRDFLAQWQIDIERLQGSRRSFARRCMDWTERRDHLAGALAAALCEKFFALNWIRRQPGTRALRVTSTGERELGKLIPLAANARLSY